MSELPEENGYRRARPLLPTGIVVASVVVALVAVSGLIVVLYRETKGPGEILRRFARAVDTADCGGSYALLAESVRRGVSEEDWCRETLPQLDANLDADFELEQAILTGDRATVIVSGVGIDRWLLQRHGERSWRIVGPARDTP